MRTRAAALAVAALILAGCGGHCTDEPRPDTILLDATELAGIGTGFEVCIIPDEDRPGDEFCAPIDSYQVSWDSSELPDSFSYVARWLNNDGQSEQVTGTFDLLCAAPTARYYLGPDY